MILVSFYSSSVAVFYMVDVQIVPVERRIKGQLHRSFVKRTAKMSRQVTNAVDNLHLHSKLLGGGPAGGEEVMTGQSASPSPAQKVLL
jgi:hypothetical protein